MKSSKLIFALSITALLISGAGVSNPVHAQPGVTVSFQSFYAGLSPYGRWINNAQYGSVWIPNVNADFHPYQTNGRWVMTDYGNTWLSNYDWGWAPFHYGRWFIDDFYGWVWVPGYEWGPGWVNWRTGGGYYGWAPLGPGLHVNVVVDIPMRWWCFVPQVYFGSASWYNYCLPRTRVVNVYHQTTIINNYYRNDNRVYAYGPRRADIERVTRNTVPVYQYSRNNNNREVIRETSPRDGRSGERYTTRGGDPGYNGRYRAEDGPSGSPRDADRGRDYSTSRRGDYGTTPSDPGDSRDRSERRESTNTSPDYGTRRGGSGYTAPPVSENPRTSRPDAGSRGNYSERVPERSSSAPESRSRGAFENNRAGGGDRSGGRLSAPERQSAPAPQSRGNAAPRRGGNEGGAPASPGRGSRGGN